MRRRPATERPRARPFHGGEEGQTIFEMLVVLALLSIVLLMISEALTNVEGQLAQATPRSQGNDQVRLAIDQIDNEVRSGNVFYNPSALTDPNPADNPPAVVPNMALVIYTQAESNTIATQQPANTSANGYRCVQWRIYNQELQSRYWAPYWAPSNFYSAWEEVADNVVNETITPPVNAFVLDSTPSYGNRLLDIEIVTQPPGSATQAHDRASVTGRDTQYNFPQNVCQTIPPY